MTDIDVHHLAAAYALDALDDRERAAFEAHYGACEVCRTDVQEFRHTLTQVSDSLVVAPPLSLKDKVMAEVAATRQLSPLVAPVVALDERRRARSLMSMAAAAAAIVMIIVGVASFRGGDQSDTFAGDLAHVMEQPDSQVLSLVSKDGAQGTFKVAWSNSLGQAVLMGDDLPTTPSDKAYELWLITPDESMAMYVLDPAKDGTVHHVLKAPADPSAWAITVEPSTGSATATGDIIFVANV
ncbi:MAG TPA: anti-sigma factor [Ilumatobacteraceae bacterium]|nr:anti-sigma factor [Ilumatobacteraceae bacterium]HRB02119.1 anti-sigma factor [Ilumatobacteraceae bacterium]